MNKMREEIINMLIEFWREAQGTSMFPNKSAEKQIDKLADAIIAKIVSELPREMDSGKYWSLWDSGWNAYHTALKNTLTGENRSAFLTKLHGDGLPK